MRRSFASSDLTGQADSRFWLDSLHADGAVGDQAIERLGLLLGPRGPELTCDECFDMLDQYVELEVADAATDQAIPDMRAHLHGCSACRDEHDSLLALVKSDG
jgi:hypothetical protein